MKTSHYWSQKIDPDRHVAVRISLGYPQYRPKTYPLTEAIRALMPTRAMLRELGDDQEAYEAAYRAKLDASGVDVIRAELRRVQDANPAGRISCCSVSRTWTSRRNGATGPWQRAGCTSKSGRSWTSSNVPN